jgi:predicted nucleic acid-binding protein
VTTLFYLLQRDLGSGPAARAIGDLLRVVGVAPVGEDRLLHALALGWNDFEDAVQAACAAKAGVDYLITRNEGDFKRASVRVMSPTQLLALVRGD